MSYDEQVGEGVSRKGHPKRRLIQSYAISNDDPVTDAREFFDPKTKELHKAVAESFHRWWDTWTEPELQEAEKG